MQPKVMSKGSQMEKSEKIVEVVQSDSETERETDGG